MKLGKLYREEIRHWRLNDEQRGLLMAFLLCLELRANGIDFERHFAALSNGQSARMEAACASE